MAIGIRAQSGVADADPTGLLNKYALPKVAMVVIATAAAVGTMLSTVVGGDLGYLQAGARYVLLMGTGTAAGGLLWAWQVVAPAARLVGGPDCVAYAARQRARFRSIERWAWLAAALGWGVLAPVYWAVRGPAGTPERTALAVSAAALLVWGLHVASGWSAARRDARGEVPPRDTGEAARASARALVAAGLLLWSVAFLQVWHDSPGDWQVLLWRVLHLSAFAAWFGGAVWNVEVAVRAARERLSVPVVIMANAQLERFRRIVRVALPLIVATGLLQVWDDMGLTRWAVEGPFGHLVLVKLGLIALLVAIFNTCPMWHACSPIAGMCDLEDLPQRRHSGSAPEATPRPSRSTR